MRRHIDEETVNNYKQRIKIAQDMQSMLVDVLQRAADRFKLFGQSRGGMSNSISNNNNNLLNQISLNQPSLKNMMFFWGWVVIWMRSHAFLDWEDRCHMKPLYRLSYAHQATNNSQDYEGD